MCCDQQSKLLQTDSSNGRREIWSENIIKKSQIWIDCQCAYSNRSVRTEIFSESFANFTSVQIPVRLNRKAQRDKAERRKTRFYLGSLLRLCQLIENRSFRSQKQNTNRTTHTRNRTIANIVAHTHTRTHATLNSQHLSVYLSIQQTDASVIDLQIINQLSLHYRSIVLRDHDPHVLNVCLLANSTNFPFA